MQYNCIEQICEEHDEINMNFELKDKWIKFKMKEVNYSNYFFVYYSTNIFKTKLFFLK